MTSQIQNIIKEFSLEELNAIKTLVLEIEKEKKGRVEKAVSINSFSSDYSKYIENNFSPSYLRSVTLAFNHLSKFFGNNRALNNISIKNAEDFKHHLMKNAPLGYKIYLRNLKAAFNKAVDWEMISFNPFSKIKISQSQQSKPIYLNNKDLDKLLNHTKSESLRKLFLFAFYSGCRLGEIVNLKWKHIDFNKKLLTIGDDDLQTKNRKTRTIPMCNILYQELKESQCVDDSDKYVFMKTNSFPFN